MSAAAPAVEAIQTPAPPAFRRDWRVIGWALAVGVSTLGDLAWFVGLSWVAVRVGGAHGGALVLGIGSVPRAVILLFGGALADRLDARRTMIATNAGRAAVLGLGVLAVHAGGLTLWPLVAVAVLFGLFDGLYLPAAGTMPRQLVRSEDLSRLSALFGLTSRLATFAGAPLGGVLVAHGGLSAVMAFDAVTFVVIGVVLAIVVRPRFARPTAPRESLIASLRGGFGYLRRHPRTRSLVVALSGLNVFLSPVTALGLSLRAHQQGWPATTFGLFTAATGAAAALGAVIALRWRPRRLAQTGLLLLVLQGAACVVIGWGDYLPTLLAMLVIGLTAGLASAMLSGAFQRTIEPAFLGRASSMTNLADTALMPVAMAVFGLIAGHSLGLACTLAGVGFAVMVSWSALRLRLAPLTTVGG